MEEDASKLRKAIWMFIMSKMLRYSTEGCNAKFFEVYRSLMKRLISYEYSGNASMLKLYAEHIYCLNLTYLDITTLIQNVKVLL